MASEGSSSSGVSAEVRIGSLEAVMGRLRAKLDDQDKTLEAVSKAGEHSWDLLNKDLRQLRADLNGNLKDFKEETRTGFKDAANTHGDFGNRITALETEVQTGKMNQRCKPLSSLHWLPISTVLFK